MRWTLNLLLMLGLAGSLAAQCSITNLNATVFDCADSQFFLSVNFQSQNTGQQGFSAQMNGIPLGNFQYANLPVTLGPFPAVAGVDYQLKVADLVDPLCNASTLVDVSSCAGLNCDDIVNLTVQTGNCNPDDTYSATLDFDAPNILPNLSFVVFASNGDSLGTFPIADLPVTIANYPNNGENQDSVTICLIGLLNCCATTQYDVPDCNTSGCDVTDLTVDVGNCNPDGSYLVKINFNSSIPGNINFSVSGNGTDLGTFPITALPLEIPNFPAGGTAGVITVCLNGNPNCCETKEFAAPNCPPDSTDCHIYNVRIKTDSCTSDTTYWVKINFKVENPDADSFTVSANNGQNLGTFPLDSLPLIITNFPYDGGNTDRITICLGNNCCATRKFRVPDCLPDIPCDIFDLAVETGDCTSDSTYNLHVNFGTKGADADSVRITIDGVAMGAFLPDSLPIALTNVPWDGGNTASITVCYSNDCCETKIFAVPDCLPGVSCEIFNLRIQPGDCNDDSTSYSLKLNFDVANPDATDFHVWGNNGDTDFGTFPLSALPLTIADFPYEGGLTDNIQICLSDDCCINRNFKVPACAQTDDCQVYDVRVRTGVCNADGTYRIRVNFKTQNTTSDSFNITAGSGQVFGPYALTDLPVFIKFFPASGDDFDELTVCLDDTTGSCCKTKKFDAPDCGGNTNCDISNLVVDPGACNPDGSYSLVLNFGTTVTDPAVQFEVKGNGQVLGTFALGDLPLTLTNFPNNNNNQGTVTVCIVGQPNCCETLEFQQPDCPSLCDIVDLVADPGACNPDGSYHLTLNFGLQTPGIALQFEVYANGQLLDTFDMSDLPLTIDSFPSNSNNVGVLKVCLLNVPNCCAIVEFQQPNCNPSGDCEINDMAVEVGDCNVDGTFNITISFVVAGTPAPDSVDIYGNDASVYFGRYAAGSAPINIHNYPSTSGSSPTVKVCAADNPDCCESVEFQAPDCPTVDPCNIFDLQVLATPCISGQFFAIVTFDFTNGGGQGFTIGGNGEIYGTYQYDDVQPIIIGPLGGDGTTDYEFVAQDNLDQNCSDSDSLGIVDCQQIDPRSGASFGEAHSMALSPNPVQDWLTVSAILPAAMLENRATVQVFGFDGRLVRSMTVADARAFGMDVSGLQPGLYRLSVLTSAGRLNGTFAKQ